MSNPDSEDKAPENGENRPKSWGYLVIGFAGVASLCIAALILFIQVQERRPLDLLSTTSALAEHLDAILQRNFIPAAAIERRGPGLRQEAAGRWYYFEYTVHVPETLNARGLRALIVAGMAERQVREIGDEGDALNLEFAIGPYPFATVALVAPAQEGTAPSPTPSDHPLPPPVATTPALEPLPPLEGDNTLTDLRQESNHAADAVLGALLRAGVASDTIEKLPPDAMEDAEATWNRAHFQLRHPQMDLEVLRDALAEQLAGRDWKIKLLEDSALSVESRERPFALIRLLPVTADSPEVHTTLLAPPDYSETESPAPVPPSTPPGDEGVGEEGEVLPAPVPAPLEDDEAPAEDATPVAAQEVAPPYDGPARVAIILDDGGYGNDYTEKILAMSPRLTLAILPYTPFGAETARRGAALGFEIMLHMPMEPEKNDKPFKGQLNVGMDALEIQRLTREALAEIPGVVGVNNHTGSRFTAHREGMRAFMEVMREQQLYFIDSVTSRKSIGFEVAKEVGVPTGRRAVFLDDRNDAAFIHKQFTLLIKRAHDSGSAIGIGHFRAGTASVLPALLKRLEDEGIALVHASELLQ